MHSEAKLYNMHSFMTIRQELKCHKVVEKVSLLSISEVSAVLKSLLGLAVDTDMGIRR